MIVETSTLPASSQAGSRPWSRAAMHWVRRIHLYSGLFMFPWVMLYAITAFLFNHPGAFADREQRLFTADDFAGTPLARPADPGADAAQIVAALNAKLAQPGSPRFRLVEPEQADYSRDVLTIRARGAGQEHSVLFDVPSGTALVSTAAQTDSPLAPFAIRGLKVPGALGDRVRSGIPKALTRQGLAADDAGMSIGTDLVFLVETDGQIWRATYSVQTGAVSGRPHENPSDLTTRRFLTQLHMTHGYPTQGTARWIWALAVDAMFASMVFWGISGLFMWWQLKAVRVGGAIILISSLIFAAIIAVAMHQSLGGP